ncbi:LCP family protein [Phosphitispora sp. TUW77]|uniref:LCP family protein n=1 Tax=Phosphitispora sp. TUW77 TaxID=3152361 RepID=UPI003AB14FAB
MMPHKRSKASLLYILALLLVFTVSFFGGKFIATLSEDADIEEKETVAQEEAEFPVNRLNVLLLGVDARPGEEDARTDSMILVSIDRDTKKIAMVSIPRDTMVEIPRHGTDKINSANAIGGSNLAIETVEGLLDIKIPYYVKTNFEGFKEIIDTLGGVDLEVEKRMYYPQEDIDLQAGQQRLMGHDALGYVRFRHDALGDITRAERQQKFLAALTGEMLKAKTIIKLPKLVPQLMDAVETNLGIKDAILLAKAAANLDSESIVTATLPGTFLNYKGISYWKADEEKAKIILNDLFRGVKLATITGPDITVPKEVKEPEESTQETGEAVSEDPGTGEAGWDTDAMPGQGSVNDETDNDKQQGQLNPNLPPEGLPEPVNPVEDNTIQPVDPAAPTIPVSPQQDSSTDNEDQPDTTETITNSATTPVVNIVTQG